MRGETFENLGWADLIRRLANNVASIFDKQLELAREEVRENISHTVKAGTMMAAGVGLLFTGFIFVWAAVIFALAPLMPGWLVALIIAFLFLIVGAVLTLLGKERIKVEPLEKTRESLREDVEWIRRQPISSGK